MAKMIKDQLAEKAAVVRSLMVEISNFADRFPGLVSRAARMDEGTAHLVDQSYGSLQAAIRELSRLPPMLTFSGTHLRLLRRLQFYTQRNEWLWPSKTRGWSGKSDETLYDLRRLGFVKINGDYNAYRISKRGERFLAEHKRKGKR